jgi:Protein of unknown function (DUF1822)
MNAMYSDSVEQVPFEFLPQGRDLVDIPAEAMAQALSLSQSIAAGRWSAYLALLALAGFEAWSAAYPEKTGLSLPCDRRQARLVLPTHPEQPATIAQLYLNHHFRLCLIATTGTVDEIIELPQAIVEQPQQVAHFYVNVMVDAEAQVAAVRGFLRYDQLQAYRQAQGLTPVNGSYILPIGQFEPRLDRLCWLATSLNPQAIPLPQQRLTPSLAPIKQLLIQPVINTGNWLQRQLSEPGLSQQLDRLSQSLGNLLALPDDFSPAMVPALGEMRGFRSANGTPSNPEADPLDESWQRHQSAVLESIQQQGYRIPVDVRVNYQDLSLDEQPLRLTFVTWQLPPDDSLPASEILPPEVATPEVATPEWSLLVIAQLLQPAAEPIGLTIQQPEGILATAQLESPDRYHVLQAIGFLHEQFTIELTNAQTAIVLPPFKFEV